MPNYKIKGKRFLRKYAAEMPTPVYGAQSDADAIAESLCDVAWVPSSVRRATFPAHSGKQETDEGNLKSRDYFDAALFCSDHNDGMHVAHANACCYRFTLPDGAVGVTLTELAAAVHCDPYNAAGARVAVYTSSDPSVPMACATCRKGSSTDESAAAQTNNGTSSTQATEWYSTNTHVEGVAPRLEDETSWYPNSGRAFVRPSGGLALQKYLFVFVLMENYATARNGYLEGSSYADPTFSIATSAAIPGWTEGETIDTAASAAADYIVASGSVVPCIMSGEKTGVREVVVRQDGNMVLSPDGTRAPTVDSSGEKAASGLMRCFSEFLSGSGEIEEASQPGIRPAGAFFSVSRETSGLPGDDISDTVQSEIWRIRSGVIAIPLTWPNGFSEGELQLDFTEIALPDGLRFNVFLKDGYCTSLTADELKGAALYDGDGTPAGMTALGSFDSGTSASFKVRRTGSKASTVVVSAYVDQQAVSASMSNGTVTTGVLFPNVKLKG